MFDHLQFFMDKENNLHFPLWISEQNNWRKKSKDEAPSLSVDYINDKF